MLQLYPIFSDHALFQCDSTLTLRGIADPAAVLTADILKDGVSFAKGTAVAANDGTFALTLDTPVGSFDVYSICISTGAETLTLSDIQFGELWMASGQSNMEMSNSHQPECKKMMQDIIGSGIRVYAINYYNDGADPNLFSMTPEDTTAGHWMTADGTHNWEGVSACATAFVLDIARKFKES